MIAVTELNGNLGAESERAATSEPDTPTQMQ
jgi:hypothetical protein